MDYTILIELVSRLGTALAQAGAETYRVEESVVRVAAAYGVTAKVYAVPNSLFITLLVPDGLPVTRLCRIEHRGTDLDAVEHFNRFSRRICAQKPALDTALALLQEENASRKSYRLPVVLLGYVMVAWGFCVFFGGSVRDCLCSGVCGLLIGLLEQVYSRTSVNIFFQKIISTFLMSVAACAMAAMGLTDNADTVIIGALMLLVPGVLFTNAMRDIIFGDTNSGINRVVETLLIAAAIALGTATAWNLAGAIWVIPQQAPAPTYSALITCLNSVLACAGFVIVFNIHGYGNLLCALGGGITWAAYCLAAYWGAGAPLCFLIATVTASVYAEIMARVRKYPAISYLVISLLPLIPGAGVYHTAQQIVAGSLENAVSYGLQTLTTAGTIAVGILLVSTVVRSWNHYRARREKIPV